MTGNGFAGSLLLAITAKAARAHPAGAELALFRTAFYASLCFRAQKCLEG